MDSTETAPPPPATQVTDEDLARMLVEKRRQLGATSTPSSTRPPATEAEPQAPPCACGERPKRRLDLPLSRNFVWVLCEPCTEAEKQREREELGRRAEAEQRARFEARAKSVREILSRLGVTRKYLDATLEGFDAVPDRKALQACHTLLDEFRRGERPSLYLFSERPGEAIAPGCGKTHLAVGILRQLVLDPEISVDDLGFVFVPRLLLEMQATFKHPEKSELAIVRKYAKPELLVWDDFGAEKLSDYAARALYTILYEREGKSNLFTSNLSPGAIEERDPTGYMQRITSRILGDARIVKMTGPDRRKKAKSA